MTNNEIIFRESLRLMQDGILAGSGRYGVYTDADGNEIKVEYPEQIHTFAAWKKAGYIVRKGEHAVASFPVWTYRENRRNDETDEDGEQQPEGRLYLKKAFFFRRSQVERITA